VIHDIDAIADRVVRLATEKVIEAIDGRLIPVSASSVLVHGDTPGAAGFAQRIRAVLEDRGVRIVPIPEAASAD
jgi:UPF0271 protein